MYYVLIIPYIWYMNTVAVHACSNFGVPYEKAFHVIQVCTYTVSCTPWERWVALGLYYKLLHCYNIQCHCPDMHFYQFLRLGLSRTSPAVICFIHTEGSLCWWPRQFLVAADAAFEGWLSCLVLNCSGRCSKKMFLHWSYVCLWCISKCICVTGAVYRLENF